MRAMFLLAVVAVLGGAAMDAGVDARLVEAQKAYQESGELAKAGRYADAIPKAERALALREEVLGKSHLDVALSLNRLGNLYQMQGLYRRAEPLYLRSLAIREAALDKNHPSIAASLNNLAVIYSDQGLYGQAEPLYLRALSIHEAIAGSNHPDVAKMLSNLATLYCQQGLYDRAEPLLQRALAIDEAALGQSHPDVGGMLNNLGGLYQAQGLSGRAEPFFARSLTTWEAVLGKDHPDVANALFNLASIYVDQESYDRAEPLLKRAIAILEAALGQSHPDLAGPLQRLGDVYVARGSYDRAEPLLERALAIREEAMGRTHPAVIQSLVALAQLRLGQRRLGEAVPLFARALGISEGRLRQEALGFSESRLAGFLQLLGKDEQRLDSLARAHPDDADVRRLALTSALLFRGRSVAQAAETSRAILRGLGPQDREAFQHLRALRTQLAQLSLDGPGPLAPAQYRERLARLEEEGDALETEIAKRSAPLRALTELPSAATIPERVASALPRDGVLVELVEYLDKPGQQRYLALVLSPDGHTAAVDLGPADAIDRVATQLRDALSRRDDGFQATARKLHQLAFKPLQRALGNARKVFLAPDGQLSVVPFAALHDGRRFLADTFDFTYLTSGRDLLPGPGDAPVPASVVVLANPDYGVSPVAAASERSAPLERFFSGERAGLAGQRWAPLPGTRQEAEAIRRLLPEAQLFLGADASKDRLLHLATPDILHIASHGFFLEDAPAPSGTRSLGTSAPLEGKAIPRPPDPLLRSGLALAGASSPSDLSNSLVTALELSGLNLWGTELVVLSACDTGRGDVRLGQGVYGLRRAFVVAGVETLVVSLWKVDDQTTHAIMESYYRNLLEGRGRAEALRLAMLSLRAQHPHPYYWAPFIAVGRDAPLRRFARAE